jgi:hypothetical protein
LAGAPCGLRWLVASSINTAAGKHIGARRKAGRGGAAGHETLRRPAMVASRRTAAPWRARGGWRAGRVEGVGFGGA